MLKKVSKKISLIFFTITLTISVSFVAFAWLSQMLVIDFPPIWGTAEVSYFESGDGSEDNPYIISNQVHLYNLAWLQYIGYFNSGPINNGRGQNYFKITKDIDMKDSVLPPIGTTEYPFLGNLDGGEHTILNLVTANKKATELIDKHPSDAKFNVTEDLLSNYGGGAAEAGAVIGLFGVVGDYNGAIHAITNEGKYVVESEISIKNLGIHNYTIKDYSNATIIGMAAGYVNAVIENILLGSCTLVIETDESTRYKIDGVSKTAISDHALVGYCTDEYLNKLSVTKISAYDPEITETTINIGGGEGSGGWGDSLAMAKLHENLTGKIADAAKADSYQYTYRFEEKTENSTTVEKEYVDGFYRNYSDSFSIIFDQYTKDLANNNDNYQYISLSGGVMNTIIEYGTIDYNGYKIYSGERYLSINMNDEGNVTDLAKSTDENNATIWQIVESEDGTQAQIYTDTINGRYYLYLGSGNANIQATQASHHYGKDEEGNTIYFEFRMGSMTSKLEYNDVNDSWKADMVFGSAGRGTYNISIKDATEKRPGIVSLDETLKFINNDDDGSNATYIPLKTASTASGEVSNTGYITSGSYYDLVGYKQYDDNSKNFPFGDVRISRYSNFNISDHDNVLVFNPNEEKFETLSTNTTSDQANNSSYQKYLTSVVQYNGFLSNSSLYGLHFMGGTISKDSLVTIPSANIYGTDYTDYEVPADCIDFTIPVEGFINFFAGTYFENNNCFFSLHQIIRGNDPRKITEIREIEKIYRSSTSYLYIYKVQKSDGYEYGYATCTNSIWSGYQSGTPDLNGYTLQFDMDWLRNSSSYDGWVGWSGTSGQGGTYRGEGYYFEIPVAPGEYALGSVSGENKIGAYLIYLDLAANGNGIFQEKITTVTELIIETSDIFEYAKGVNVVSKSANDTTSDDNDPQGYISLSLKEGFSGSLEISRAADDIIIDGNANFGDTGNAMLHSVNQGLTVNGGVVQTVSSSTVISKITKRKTYMKNGAVEVIVTYVKVGDDPPTITAKDGSGIDVSLTKISVDEETYITTVSIDGSPIIDWNAEYWSTMESNKVLEYTYNIPSDDANIKSDFSYSENSYSVTITSNTNITVTITDVNESEEYNVKSSKVNGQEAVEGNTITITS